MIKQIFSGLLLGLIIIIIALPHNPYIKQIIDDGFKQAFADALDCTIECTVDNVNFLQPGLELSDVTVTPRNGAQGWKWTAKKYDMYCSWWHLITKGIVNLHVDMNEVNASTDIIKGELAIMPHLQRMAVGDPNVPMSTHYIHLQKATFAVMDPNAAMRYSMTWKSKTIKQGNRLESRIHIIDGDITHQLKKYANNVQGNLFCGVNETGNPELVIDGTLGMTINHILKQPITTQCKLEWNYDQGAIRLIHDDQILQIKECRFKTNNDALEIHAVLDFELKCLSALERVSIPVMGKGTAVVDVQVNKDTQQLSLAVMGTDFGYDKKVYASTFSAQGDYKNNQWTGTLDAQTIYGPLSLNIKSKKELFSIDGACDGYSLDAQLSYADRLQLHSACIKDSSNNSVMTVSSLDKKINLALDLDQLSKAIKKYMNIDVQAQGIINSEISFDKNQIFCSAEINKGFIRIPETFNGITHADIAVSFDCIDTKLFVKKATIHLNEGTISCTNGTLKFTPDGTIESYYANAIIDHVLFNVLTSIDLYCSGNVIITKKIDQNPTLSGAIILDELQLRQNPLSTSFISKIMQASTQTTATDINIDCDFSIATKKPIKVITPWIEITARAQVTLKNNFVHPSLAGSISLEDGIIHLPYKPLIISHGLVIFDPQRIDNPFIELTAQNTIKQHDVSMQLAGPLQQLNISLLSNPVLNESQIVALLLTGSAYGSLGIMVPSLALYSIKNLLFDIEQSPIKVSERTQEWLKPLRSVRFVPLFDDQRARGGLRGAFEIEVTDRIHALIQKNFTLTEDTRFELEYTLSDNMSIRAVRDERRDVNGQVEMRWKF